MEIARTQAKSGSIPQKAGMFQSRGFGEQTEDNEQKLSSPNIQRSLDGSARLGHKFANGPIFSPPAIQRKSSEAEPIQNNLQIQASQTTPVIQRYTTDDFERFAADRICDIDRLPFYSQEAKVQASRMALVYKGGVTGLHLEFFDRYVRGEGGTKEVNFTEIIQGDATLRKKLEDAVNSKSSDSGEIAIAQSNYQKREYM